MKTTVLTFVFIILGVVYAHSQKIKRLIDKGDVIKLEKYISKGGDINTPINTPLFFEDNNTSINYELHPMVYAAGDSNDEIVKLFVEYNDKIENYDQVLGHALSASISSGNNSLSMYLIDQSPNINSVCSFCRNSTPTMIAALYNNEELFFMMAEMNPDYSIVNNEGNNFHHMAATSGNMKIIEHVYNNCSIDVAALTTSGLIITGLRLYLKLLYDIYCSSLSFKLKLEVSLVPNTLINYSLNNV